MAKNKRKIPYVHERGGRLYVRVPYYAGDKYKTKERRVDDIDEALRVIQEIKQELGILGPRAFDGEKMTFPDLLGQYKIAFPEKPKHYIEPLEAFFCDRKIKTITYGDLRQFKIAREQVKSIHTGEPRKPATINREIEQLRAVLLYAVRHGWIKHNPFTAGPSLIEKDKEEHRTRVPTPAEEAAILAVCVPPREHLHALIIATRDTGLRRSALLSLTWSMVEWDSRLLRVPKGNSYKRRPGTIGLSLRLFEELQERWDRSDRNPDAKIFGDIQDFKHSYATACRLAGVEGLRFNDFRHGFATDLMEAGIPQHFAMKAAGHTQVSIHERYVNVDDRLALQVAAALNRLHSRRQGGADPDPDHFPPASFGDGSGWIN